MHFLNEADTVLGQEEKKGIESTIRAHLHGFARTIPSFLMAYGSENRRLANFEAGITPEVFEEVTGITIEEFRFLRDGGAYRDEMTGKTEHFASQFFDPVVFDDSVQEFLAKKNELRNYFREDQDEDIFDYIPPQKTNQIYTPRKIVALMVDILKQENPACFDDPEKTFADLYMNSGLYIAEIVKMLFRSEGLKAKFRDDRERIEHILRNQVFGIAPSEIIYRIATNYILGVDEEMKSMTENFKMADDDASAKVGTLQELVEREFKR